MKLKDLFNEIILDLIKSNNEDFDFKNNFGGMQTSVNGQTLIYSKKAASLINSFSKVMYENFGKKNKVDYQKFHMIVNQEIANSITSDDFKIENVEEVRKAVQGKVEENFKNLEEIKITHHFPASTLNFNFREPIILGNVHIQNIEQWLNKVSYSKDIIEWYNKASKNSDWKQEVKECLKNNLHVDQISNLAQSVFYTIQNSNSIVTVEINGYEPQLSKKFAKQICKAALDMISLAMADQRVFYNNILQLERLPSLKYGDFSEKNGYLDLPSSGLSKAFLPELDVSQYEHIERLISGVTEPFSFIINGMLNPESVSCPNLVSKWYFALNWYAEGMRESNDAISVAKLASCLDTLSSNGRYGGITDLLCNVYDCNEDYILFESHTDRPITISMFVRKFYDEGRSRILHGTIKNMLESFEIDRNRLATVARWALLELANRLYVYRGDDAERAFRSMKYDS